MSSPKNSSLPLSDTTDLNELINIVGSLRDTINKLEVLVDGLEEKVDLLAPYIEEEKKKEEKNKYLGLKIRIEGTTLPAIAEIACDEARHYRAQIEAFIKESNVDGSTHEVVYFPDQKICALVPKKTDRTRSGEAITFYPYLELS